MDEVHGGRTAHRSGRASERSAAPASGPRRRLCLLTAALFACALGSVPAFAVPDLTPVTVPPLGGQVEDSPPITQPPVTPTTAPAPTPSTTPRATSPGVAKPSPSSSPAPTGDGSTRRRRTRPAPRRNPAVVEQPPATALVDVSHPADREGRAIERLRDASLPAARQFGFPLGLGVVVLGFLAVQGRLDGRDPKLATAPVSVHDDLLPFS